MKKQDETIEINMCHLSDDTLISMAHDIQMSIHDIEEFNSRTLLIKLTDIVYYIYQYINWRLHR